MPTAMPLEKGFGRSPTFLVGATDQRHNLDQLQRREQHLAEQYQKNKPLCFNARTYQLTHPHKAKQGHRDADAALVSPIILGVADGVSQIEEFGIDASLLPRELLRACEDMAMAQLLPDAKGNVGGEYRGPIPLMREAFECTDSLGSTTICLGILDNSTRIHGKLHPMIAVLSIGDCEMLILRRLHGQRLETVFQTEMQRIDGNAQCPLQVVRIDERVDPDFDERISIEVIERGSAVHCVSVYEGDIVVIGSDGVFDNLFHDEVVAICNSILPPTQPGSKFAPLDPALLEQAARRVVAECHGKTQAGLGGVYPDTPIGKGGKRDDTSCVVGEVVEWTEDHCRQWSGVRRQHDWKRLVACGSGFTGCCDEGDAGDDGEEICTSHWHNSQKPKRYPHAQGEGGGSEEEDNHANGCQIS